MGQNNCSIRVPNTAARYGFGVCLAFGNKIEVNKTAAILTECTPLSV